MEYEPDIVYEDTSLLVVDKPSGLLVHGDGRSNEFTLTEWILARRPAMRTVGEPWTNPKGVVIDRPGIVHRLDRDTSGVMLLAKTPEAFMFLKNAFKEHRVHKTYHAFVYGNIKEDEGYIDKPIGRSPSDFRRWSAQPGARGKMREAYTEYAVQQRGDDVVFVDLRPRTGRTHQLRVHLKAIHHPIVCDSLYAPKKPHLLGMKRLALHASRITFIWMSGETVDFRVKLPADMAQALANIKNM